MSLSNRFAAPKKSPMAALLRILARVAVLLMPGMALLLVLGVRVRTPRSGRSGRGGGERRGDQMHHVNSPDLE